MDEVRTGIASRPLFPDSPVLDFTPTVKGMIDELMASNRDELATQLKQADIIGRLDTLGEIKERGGVTVVLATMAKKAWPATRVSKRRTVYAYLIEPLSLEEIEDITTREEKTIRDFEVLYLAARMVKQSDGDLKPLDALGMCYDKSRDEVRDMMNGAKTEEDAGGEDEDDTWADFVQRLPATLVGKLSNSIGHICQTLGLTNLQFWDRLALILEETPNKEMGTLMEAAESGYSSFVRVLAPNANGEVVNSSGVPVEIKELALPAPASPAVDADPLFDDKANPESGMVEKHPFDVPAYAPPKDQWPTGVTWDAERGKWLVRGPRPDRKLIGRFEADRYQDACAALAGSKVVQS